MDIQENAWAGVAVSYQRGNVPSGSINGGEFVDCPRDY